MPVRIWGWVPIIVLWGATSAVAQSTPLKEESYLRGSWRLDLYRDVWTDRRELQAHAARPAIVNMRGEAHLAMLCVDRAPQLVLRWPTQLFIETDRMVVMRVRQGRSPVAEARWSGELHDAVSLPFQNLFWRATPADLRRMLSAPNLAVGPVTPTNVAAVFDLSGAAAAYEDLSNFCATGALPAR